MNKIIAAAGEDHSGAFGCVSIRLCRNCGIKTVVENDAAPTMNIMRLEVAKFRFLNRRTSTIGSLTYISQMTSATRQMTEIIESVVMKLDPNQ